MQQAAAEIRKNFQLKYKLTTYTGYSATYGRKWKRLILDVVCVLSVCVIDKRMEYSGYSILDGVSQNRVAMPSVVNFVVASLRRRVTPYHSGFDYHCAAPQMTPSACTLYGT